MEPAPLPSAARAALLGAAAAGVLAAGTGAGVKLALAAAGAAGAACGLMVRHYRATAALPPELAVGDGPRIARLVAACDSLHRAYRPPLLMYGSALQLAWFVLQSRLRKAETFTREELVMGDGGEVALDWLDGSEHLAPDAPVLAIMHTITGNSDDFCELADRARRRGYRVVVLLRRGHLGKGLKTPQFNILGYVPDAQAQLERVRQRFPAARVYGYSASAGTGLIVRYAGEMGARSLLDAIVCCCPGYDTSRGGAFSNFVPALDKFLLGAVHRLFLKPNEALLRGVEGYSGCVAASSMAELQESLYALEGFASPEEYYDRTNPMAVAHDISVPALVINAEDDPICSKVNVERNMGVFVRDRALALTRRGTHCCFYEGGLLVPTSRWSETAALEFFDACHAEEEAPSR